MNDRVARLRQQSLEAIPTVSAERAVLMTRFYGTPPDFRPVQRALAFKYVLENKAICINDGELIVGERGPAPKATGTCPELCCHSLDDLDILDTREKTWFRVDAETRRAYEEEVIPYWKGRTIRERIFAEMTDEWLASYEAGLFTEFMEQRAPGHTVLDDKIYRKGMLDFMDEIDRELAELDYCKRRDAFRKQQQLKAMRITAEALITFAAAIADKAVSWRPPKRSRPPGRTGKDRPCCQRVPAHRPETFHEALHTLLVCPSRRHHRTESWDAYNPGRLDQIFTVLSPRLDAGI
jgi:formate C-acetyltransferase